MFNSSQRLWKYCSYLALLALGVGLAMALGYFCLRQTRGFALYKICSALKYNPMWALPPLTQKEQQLLKNILDQPYYFLDKGAQAYVFLSADKKYVIKFFKIHSITPPPWLNILQLPLHLQPRKIEKILQKKETLTKTFTSYKITYEELKEQTGLVFLHLNKSDFLHQRLTIFDNLGIAHHLDLDQMEFLVQKRADPFFPFLEKQIEQHGYQAAKKSISDLIAFLVMRNQKEIFDKDPDLTTNFGFLQGKLIQIDVGRFRKDPLRNQPSVYRSEIIAITDLFNKWLKEHHPLLSDHLEHEIKSHI